MFDNNRIPQAAPAARTVDIDIEKEVRHVKHKLQTADDRQAMRLAKSRAIVAFLDKEPLLRDDAMDIGELGVAKKDVRLNSLTIGAIGQSGCGKSTTSAALTGGRSDTHLSGSGKALTAGIIRTFMDIDPASGEGEYALLQMRTATELLALAERQLKTLGVDDFRLPTDIEDLPAAIHALGIEATPALEALLEVIEQFIRHEDLITGPVENRRIPLDSPSGLQRLESIVREGTPENLNPEQRIVDIVKTIDIHLHRPAREDDTCLQLLDTCLVDTPGTGGSPLHSWRLRDLIFGADGNLDVILFCINPRRVTETEFELARSLNEAITSGNLHPQQVLLVHNAIDEQVQHDESETAISELMHVCGGPEMFQIHETSALAALWGLQARNGKPIPNPEKYRSMAVALGLDPEDVRDLDDPELHTAVYEKSGLPELIQAINKVTRGYTVEVRVKAAETSVNNTVSRLSAHYDTEHERVAEQLSKHGPPDVKAVKVLAAMEADAKAYIAEKRAALLEIEPEEKLQTLFTEASESLYTRLGEVLPKLWKSVPDRLRTVPKPIIHRPLPRTFISDIEEWIWQHLDLVPVGRYFADRIEKEFGENTYTELLHFGFDTPIAKEVMRLETVREMTRTMGNDISDFSKNIGKAMLGKPKYRLLRSDLSTPSPVVEILETIANTHDVDAEHFDFEGLRDAIRESYETGIKEAVAAIRGFHEAKLADIEIAFTELISQTFIRLQDNRETLGATLFDAVDDEIHALHLQKQTLDEKRARLKTIETFMTATDTDEPAS